MNGYGNSCDVGTGVERTSAVAGPLFINQVQRDRWRDSVANGANPRRDLLLRSALDDDCSRDARGAHSL